jgi:pimeloyl-ACP methyl ester carboxylesterase
MRLPFLLRCLLLGALLARVGPAAIAADAGLEPCRLRGLEHDALCGVLKRPLDPQQPQGRQIDVHFAVVPALARNKKPDAVFFFAGGPGQSAMDLAGPVAGLLQRFLNRHDLVLIDQRGTGRSAPLKCDDDDPGRPLAQTLDPAHQVQALLRCREALQRLPYGDLRQFTTPIAMQDAEAVRQRLGVERIDAIGASYGTRAVLEYQRQFPQHVRRAVIDGVAPPDMVLPASFSSDNQAALDALLAACEAEAACRERHPALRAQWRQLLTRLPRTVTVAHPLTGLPERVTMTRELVLGMVRLPLYVPALSAGLPRAIADAAAGRFEALAALASGMQGRRQSMALSEGMHFSVVCAEDFPRLGSSPDKPGADFGDGFAGLYRQVCAQWPRGSVPEAFYQLRPARSATLVLSGSADPVTPPRHGERVAKALGAHALVVVVPNAGHGVMAVGCMSDVVFRFVDAETDEEALQVDARCAQSVPRPPAFEPIRPAGPAASGAAVRPVAWEGAQ